MHMTNVSEILEEAKRAKLENVRIQFTDILGSPKNIVIPEWRLEEALEEGIAFDASSIQGYATIEESDLIARPDLGTWRILPDTLEKRVTARFNCDIYEPDGKRYSGDPKYVLEKVVEKARAMGFSNVNFGPECEFFLLKKNNGCLTATPNDNGGYFDLSPLDLAENVRGDISAMLQAMGFQVYTTHHEVAPGQHEINFQYSDPLTTADRVVTLKYVAKVVALQHNMHATFMPKPIYGQNGTGMHTHMSLVGKDGNAFKDPDDGNGLSETAYSYIAGLLYYSKEINAVLNSWVNSFKRLVPGYEAPCYIAWAMQNRSALIRIPAKRGEGTRVELRNPDPAGNPYLQFAVMLAAGLRGIENKMRPPKPVELDIYGMSPEERGRRGVESLPGNLGHALSFMEESELMKEVLGPHLFNTFLHLKYMEFNEYRTQVTNWEIEKFLPVL
ncbi:MAG: type I glutamate--ammonia ligase [Thermoplasmata archaeon]|nr:type I glutamate--ammonia ligase [Thermoplasmata archaeon]